MRCRTACLALLAVQLWLNQLAAGQGFIPAIPRLVPQRAGVINDSPTAGPWVIYELRLFFSPECDTATQITPFFTDVYDTGTHRETELFTNGQYVFDGAEYTNWTSDCRVSLGGCPARTVSVGVDISYMAAFEEAFARKDSSWNITGKGGSGGSAVQQRFHGHGEVIQIPNIAHMHDPSIQSTATCNCSDFGVHNPHTAHSHR